VLTGVGRAANAAALRLATSIGWAQDLASILRRFLLIAVCLLLPAPTRASAWTSAPRAFVSLRVASPEALAAFADRLEAAGGHASVIEASGTAIVYADDAALARAEVAGDITATFRSHVDGGGGA
jgi:hypothetical protein